MDMEAEASIRCPRCGEQGSIQTKTVRNNYGKEYQYRYVAHYSYDPSKAKSTRIRWHYVGKTKPLPLPNSPKPREASRTARHRTSKGKKGAADR